MTNTKTSPAAVVTERPSSNNFQEFAAWKIDDILTSIKKPIWYTVKWFKDKCRLVLEYSNWKIITSDEDLKISYTVDLMKVYINKRFISTLDNQELNKSLIDFYYLIKNDIDRWDEVTYKWKKYSVIKITPEWKCVINIEWKEVKINGEELILKKKISKIKENDKANWNSNAVNTKNELMLKDFKKFRDFLNTKSITNIVDYKYCSYLYLDIYPWFDNYWDSRKEMKNNLKALKNIPAKLRNKRFSKEFLEYLFPDDCMQKSEFTRKLIEAPFREIKGKKMNDIRTNPNSMNNLRKIVAILKDRDLDNSYEITSTIWRMSNPIIQEIFDHIENEVLQKD